MNVVREDIRPQQLSLPVRLSDQATFDNFYSVSGSSHRQVVEMLAGNDGMPGETFVFLWGGAGRGVSHLLQAACQQARTRRLQSQYLPLSDLKDFPARQLLDNLENLDLICLDDLQVIAGDPEWEREIFTLYNSVRERGGKLLVSADAPPGQLKLSLADLESRLCWGPVFLLPDLSDEEKADIIQFRAARRGMEFADEPAKYLVTHSGRELSELMGRLDTLERLAIYERRKLTIPFLKKTFGW